MGNHSYKGVLTGQELNVIGRDGKRNKNHRRPDGAVCMRHKNIGGRSWQFWPSNFRIGHTFIDAFIDFPSPKYAEVIPIRKTG